MRNSDNKTERGQALVLIVLAIVAVFGFSALAIDGGMLYAERRRAQNAADTAVFAAAMAGLKGANYVAAGQNQAAMNGFVNDAQNKVWVHHPPVSGVFQGKNDYYQVIIQTEFSPFFAQFVYSGKLQNTVEAVARAKPSTSVSPGNAVHATSTDQCHAVWFQGASGTVITDANVYSNSSAPGTSSCASGIKKNGDLTLVNGTVVTVGGFVGKDGVVMYDSNGVKLTQAEVNAAIKDNDPALREEIPNITPPVCAGMSTRNQNDYKDASGNFNLPPGIYPNGLDVGNSVMTLQRGIYCLDGDLKANANGQLVGDQGVLIYMRGSSSNPNPSITLNGGANIILKSATGTPLFDNANPPKDWSGMVIYMRQENGGTIDLAGGANSFLWGTIYAPGPISSGAGAKSAKCDIQGNSESFNFRAQVICYTVGITGSAKLQIHYKEAEQYHEPPTIELSQ